MLSVFPEVLFLSPLAPFLIRAALGILFAHSAWNHIQKTDTAPRILAVFEAALGVVLALGAWTQPAALAAAAVAIVWLARPDIRTTAASTALLALVMSLSLIVTGAGAYAFDLPL